MWGTDLEQDIKHCFSPDDPVEIIRRLQRKKEELRAGAQGKNWAADTLEQMGRLDPIVMGVSYRAPRGARLSYASFLCTVVRKAWLTLTRVAGRTSSLDEVLEAERRANTVSAPWVGCGV